MPIKLSQKQIIIIGGGILIVAGLVALIYFSTRQINNSGPPVILTVWGTEDPGGISALVAAYPSAKTSYVQVDTATYREKLLAALAAGVGPDVFEIENRDLAQWRSVIAPFPTSSAQISPLQVSQLFPDVVTQDFVFRGQIYGLPLSIDTLAMFYNKDLFNTAGIATPPVTWSDFLMDIAPLRAMNAQGQLVRAAAAIGGSRASVPNAPDLISLLMMQNGAQMTSGDLTSATFASQTNNKGIDAFNFYIQFANAASPNYTWNDGMGNAITSFVNGKTAIMFGYQADLAAIEAKAPFLNIGIAPMLQAKGATIAVNYPDYMGLVAAKAGKSVVTAQNLVLYLTMAELKL